MFYIKCLGVKKLKMLNSKESITDLKQNVGERRCKKIQQLKDSFKQNTEMRRETNKKNMPLWVFYSLVLLIF